TFFVRNRRSNSAGLSPRGPGASSKSSGLVRRRPRRLSTTHHGLDRTRVVRRKARCFARYFQARERRMIHLKERRVAAPSDRALLLRSLRRPSLISLILVDHSSANLSWSTPRNDF